MVYAYKFLLQVCRCHKTSIDQSSVRVVILRSFVVTIQSPSGSHYVSTFNSINYLSKHPFLCITLLTIVEET